MMRSPLVIVPVQDCLYARRLAGTGIAKQQDSYSHCAPLRTPPYYRSASALLKLIADEMSSSLTCADIRDRLDPHAALRSCATRNALCKPKRSNAEFLVEFDTMLLRESFERLCSRPAVRSAQQIRSRMRRLNSFPVDSVTCYNAKILQTLRPAACAPAP